ncbi:MAG: alpha/beta hydrolase [Alphaproteobacteria bacterium]|nr:alpha/beta hydrolase [Alphaproteobacteria bacterium]
MRTILSLLFACCAAACSPLTLVNASVSKAGYSRTEAVAYGPAPRQRLSIYRPADVQTPAPVVVFFYGGSWRNGNRRDYRFAGAALASRGVVAVLPDYRLYPEVRFPAFVNDGAAAVAWVHANIDRFGGDPDRIFLMGHSAGAHIAAHLALDRRRLAAAGVPDQAIAGMIGLAGPYALDPLAYRSTRAVFAGQPDIEAAKPITFARADAPPMLLLHGSDDDTVSPWNSEQLAARLAAAGAEARLVAYPDVGHIGILLALAPQFRNWAPVLDDSARFIRTHAPSATAATRAGDTSRASPDIAQSPSIQPVRRTLRERNPRNVR